MSDLIIAIDARLAAGNSTGDSSYWTGLLYGLSRISPKAQFLLFSNVEKPPAIPDHKQFRWVQVPGTRSRWWGMVAFPLAARRSHASAVHGQYNLSPLTGRRGITTIHDVSFLIGPQWFKNKDLAILRGFVPGSVRRARRVLTVSNTSKEEIERLIPEARGKTVATPLACPVHINPDSRVDVRAKFNLPAQYLLTVGTRWPRKNMRLAVDAAARTPFTLVVTGKAGWGEETSAANVVTTGFVDDESLSALYREASMYLAPSFHEGFGLPLLEAFACGCPVVCSSGGAMPEVAGDAALVMPGWDPESWSAAIQELMQDSSKLESLTRLGRERESEFTWEKTASLTMRVYEEVAMESHS